MISHTVIQCFTRNRTCEVVTKKTFHRMSEQFLNQSAVQPVNTAFTCSSQKLMLYNGVAYQESSGVYHLLPFGQRAMNKLINLITIEMEKIKAQKMIMPCLSSASLWKQSGRWKDMGEELFRLKDRHQHDYCLGPTHEESITSLVGAHCPMSYRDLPVYLYQINVKFRDEVLPKYGLLRAREFLMKDLRMAQETYSIVYNTYCKILKILEVPFVKVKAAPGKIGGISSHEFHLPSPVGEDQMYICHRCGDGENIEVGDGDMNSKKVCKVCNSDAQTELISGIEVGHTFLLGEKYSSMFKCTFKDKKNQLQYMQMGCYGLGVSRILQACIQVLSTDKCIRWPYVIAPHDVCIIPQKEGYKCEEFMQKSRELAFYLETSGEASMADVLVDDRVDMTVGKRIYEAKRRGLPYIVVVNKEALTNQISKYEFIDVYRGGTSYLTKDEILFYHSSCDHSITPQSHQQVL